MWHRAAEIFGEFLPQTPSLSLTQTVTPYQFLGPYDIVLPRHESFEAGHFISVYECKKRCCRDPKIGMESRFGSNSMMEFEAKIHKKIWAALIYIWVEI